MNTAPRESGGRTGRFVRRALLALSAALALSACHQNGTLFLVDTTDDTTDANAGDGLCADATGSCSLRAAVMEANALPGVEEIRLADGATYTLSLFGIEDAAAAGDLDITEAVVITGDATIAAASPFIGRVVHISHLSGLVEIDGPDLSGGADTLEFQATGAALLHDGAGNASVLRSEITGNATVGAVVASTGPGTLYLWSSTVHANNLAGTTSSSVGVTSGVLDLQNATIEGRDDPFFDRPAVTTTGGTATVAHSTILGRWTGGGTVSSSIVQECGAPSPTSGGHNVNPDGSCGFSAVGDQTVDPELGPITDNGGGVPTAAPLPGSPVLDTNGGANCTIFSLDARDEPRPNNGTCDTGAVELQVGSDCANPGPGAQLQYCDLTNQSFTAIDLTGADLTGADLTDTGPHLFADFTDASLIDTDLTNANLSLTTLTGADLTGATAVSLKATNLTGTAAALPTDWSQVGNSLIGPFADVIGFDFTASDLTGVTATDVEAALADFVDANLTNAVFDRTDFDSADLRGATTTGASFVDAVWDDTWCPDGTLSTTNPGQTCNGHL